MDYLIADISQDLQVVLTRFSGDLSGEDLAAIRTQVAGLSQIELSAQWNISRNLISRIENNQHPNRGMSDRYMGLLVRTLLERLSKTTEKRVD